MKDNLRLVLQEYPKLSTSYYLLLDCLAQDHITFIASLEPRAFLYILESISKGLTALGEYFNLSLGLYNRFDYCLFVIQTQQCVPHAVPL